MTNEEIPTKKFCVKLGFSRVTVECISKEEAIGLARKELSDDMPRLTDVIMTTDEKRFQVDEIQDGPSL